MVEKAIRTSARALPYQRVSRTRSGISKLQPVPAVLGIDERTGSHPEQFFRMRKRSVQQGRSERSGGVWGILLVGLQHVSNAANRLNELLAATSIDLVAQIVHVDIDDVRKCVKVLVPHMLGDHRSGEDAARVSHQIFEQRIFLESQVDPLPSPNYFTGRRIEDQIIDLEYAKALGGSSAKKGSNPRQQLIDGEWFGEIVVGSGVESLDPLVHL